MDHRSSRRSLLAAVGTTAFLAGCLGGGGQPSSSSTDDPAATNEDVTEFTLDSDLDPVTVGEDPPSDEPENAPPFSDRVLSLPIPPSELSDRAQDGGPPKDGIPSIDDPSFVAADEADFLEDETAVFGVVDGEAKAYPRRVLTQHEIVNDTLDGRPVSVSYCPLTGTAQGFERGDTELGVSGMLINNNLVMYDRERDRLWPQIPATSIPGPWNDTPGGATLQEFNVIWTTWGQWRNEHPDTVIMTEETGFARNYDRDPYGSRGYYESDTTLFPNVFESDRHHPKKFVYGTRTSDGAIAFLKETLQDVGVIHGSTGGVGYVAVNDPRLDTAYVYRNPDGQAFSYDDGTVSDDSGETYAPDELPLDRVLNFDAYWFAWVAYYPNSVFYE